uniref:Reverse transcriptase domain-containing protein n=1 Tax=Tanacetum cinerariifolium TaxID=118510 RepID=A0A6L2JK30_TANCI|nr:hypothetical protein [Tanacetum cinerariifolium]
MSVKSPSGLLLGPMLSHVFVSSRLLIPPPGEDKEPEATTDTEPPSTEDIQPLPVQEPPQDSDFHQLIKECCTENFKVVHKSSVYSNTSQISLILSIAPILSTKEPEHLLSMGYEHLSITPETESDEVTESNVENLLPIPTFNTFSNPLFKDNDDLDSRDDESLPDEDVLAEEFKIYSNPLFDEDEINSNKLDPHCFNVESDFVESLLNQIPKADFNFMEDIHFIENLLYDNSSPRPPEDLNAEIADTIIESLPSSSIPVHDNDAREEIDLLPNAEPDQESMNDISDDSTNDPFMKEVNLFLATDHWIPPSIENYYDTERDIHFLKALLVDDFIPFSKNESSNFEDVPSIPRPPPEPPDDEYDLEPEVISAVMHNIDEPNKDESFKPGGEIFVSTNNEDVDCFPFMIVIRIFLPYLVLPKISPLFLFAESEDTIFDPGISD